MYIYIYGFIYKHINMCIYTYIHAYGNEQICSRQSVSQWGGGASAHLASQGVPCL